MKRFLILCMVVLVSMLSLTACGGGSSLEGTWAWEDDSSIHIIFYNGGTLDDEGSLLRECFDSDGELISWEKLDSSNLKISSNWSEQYVIGYSIQSGTLTLDLDYEELRFNKVS
ncbi:MAG: DUF748 domain-containing protein [Clostridiales bacterium]|nr:DUF748 domain-containing protein [Clostridiales bacterium]